MSLLDCPGKSRATRTFRDTLVETLMKFQVVGSISVPCQSVDPDCQLLELDLLSS